MRKVIGFFLIVMIVLSQFSLVSFSLNNNTDIIVSTYTALDNGSISEGIDFQLYVALQNISSSSFDNISIIISPSSSFGASRGSTLTKQLSDKLEPFQQMSIGFNLRCNDTVDSKLLITVRYRQDSRLYEVHEEVNLDVKLRSDSRPSQPTDTSKYFPKLNVSNKAIPVGEAGKNIDIPLVIKNNSSFQANNVSIIPSFELIDKNPFIFNNIVLTHNFLKIEDNESVSTVLRFDIDRMAEEKNYPITLNYTYFNIFGDKFTSSEVIYIRVVNKNTVPKITLKSRRLFPEKVQSGENLYIGLDLKNVGNMAAKDIKVSLLGLRSDEFSLYNSSNIKYVAEIQGNKEELVEYVLISSNKMESGSYGLSAKVDFRDEKGNNYSEDFQFFVYVEGKESDSIKGSPNLTINNITSPKHELRSNEDFNIDFNLKNTGDSKAYNVKVSLESDNVIIPKSSSIKMVNQLEQGMEEKFQFTLSSTSDVTSKNYPIMIKVEYEEDRNGQRIKHTLNQYVGVYIQNEKDNKNIKTVPKIIIDNSNWYPSIVRAGETFDLNLSFLNTNSVKSVQNIKIYLTVTESTNESGSVFTPVGGSNTFFIDYIGPKRNVQKSLTMFTVPDAKPKNYTITANIEYEDEEGNEYRATELIGIPVVQQARLEVNEISLPPQVFVGQPIPIFLEFYNMGKVTLYNLMVKAEGNFQAQNSNYFVGNFDMGRSEYYEVMIMPTEPGPLNGSIVFSYDDTAGQHVEIRKDFSMTVMEMQQEMFPPGGHDKYFPEPPMKEALWKRVIKNKYTWISLGILTALIVSIKFYRKNKREKGLAFDE